MAYLRSIETRGKSSQLIYHIWGSLEKLFVGFTERQSDLEKINSDKKNADISLKQNAKLQEIEVVKSKKVKLQESIDFKENKLKQG